MTRYGLSERKERSSGRRTCWYQHSRETRGPSSAQWWTVGTNQYCGYWAACSIGIEYHEGPSRESGTSHISSKIHLNCSTAEEAMRLWHMQPSRR